MRTGIEIDDELMREAMKATGTTTKRAAIEKALRKLILVRDHDKAVAEIFRKQEIERKAAMRAGRLEEWHEALVKKGNWPPYPSEAEIVDTGDDLMRRAMAASGKSTKKATIEEALRLVVQLKTQEGIKRLRGKIRWEGNLDEMRRSRFLDAEEPIEQGPKKSKESAA